MARYDRRDEVEAQQVGSIRCGTIRMDQPYRPNDQPLPYEAVEWRWIVLVRHGVPDLQGYRACQCSSAGAAPNRGVLPWNPCLEPTALAIAGRKNCSGQHGQARGTRLG